MKNTKADKEWLFRTLNNGTNFTATLDGTGGAEFAVANTTTDFTNAKMVVGGVTVFENGSLVDSNGVTIASLIDEQSKVLARMEAEAKAKDAEIIAMEAEAKAKGQKIVMMEAKAGIMEAEISDLKIMKQKVAMTESILTNLALNSSDMDKAKVSINLK